MQGRTGTLLTIGMLLGQLVFAQSSSPNESPTPAPVAAGSSAAVGEAKQETQGDGTEGRTEAVTPAAAPAATPVASEAARRAELNLLGTADAASGESKRNENVQFNLVDNNAQKELATRLGTSATLLKEFQAERNYFSAEFGNAPSPILHTERQKGSGVHGQLFYRHLNSIFSARSFFQVGGVQPARENEFGFGFSASPWKNARLSLEGSQRRIRGQVNGNVLVPLVSERTPLATNPAVRAIVQQILDAYPLAPPNRTDIDPRMLNTNALQSIDGDTAGVKLDQRVSSKDQLASSYQFVGQKVLAFQFVRGQNPDTTTKSHRGRLTWTRSISATTILDATVGVDRVGVLIVPGRGHIGPSVFVSGGALTTINSSTQVPIDRAQNEFREGVRLRMLRGRHTITLGSDLLRRQLNGYDSDNHLGTLSFRANFGTDAITNLRLGQPTTAWRAIGIIHRGFRTWESNTYVADTWRATTNLTVTAGLRWRPITRPTEVNGFTQVPYGNDWNNLGPLVGLAYRSDWGVWRASYGLFHGEVFPATYQQMRFNPPWNVKHVINDPDITNPLRAVDLTAAPRGVFYSIDSELATPYTQTANLVWERSFAKKWNLQAGVLSSRSKKLLLHWYENRARMVPGMPLITGNINQRRADERYTDIRRVVGSGKAWFDAARITLTTNGWHGLTLESSYWFSKNIDTGADYTSTAYDMDSFRGMSQSEANVASDLRGLSRFDQPHALLNRVNYLTPKANNRLLRWAGAWDLGAIILLKTGTPFTVNSGSDAPGYGNVDGANGDRVNLVDRAILGTVIGNPDTSKQLLPRSAFSFMPVGATTGNLGRNTFRRGKIANINASVERAVRLPNELELRFRAESVNLFNTPQFAEPGFALADANFASITNTLNEGRTLRMGLTVRF